jgi:hypothetical protein
MRTEPAHAGSIAQPNWTVPSQALPRGYANEARSSGRGEGRDAPVSGVKISSI